MGISRKKRGSWVEEWLRAIPAFLARALGPTPGSRRALLHADLCGDNLLVREEGGRAPATCTFRSAGAPAPREPAELARRLWPLA